MRGEKKPTSKVVKKAASPSMQHYYDGQTGIHQYSISIETTLFDAIQQYKALTDDLDLALIENREIDGDKRMFVIYSKADYNFMYEDYEMSILAWEGVYNG